MEHEKEQSEEEQKGDAKESDVEKSYSTGEVVAKLRRLADALEQGTSFDIQIAGERIFMPATATVEVEFEYERNGDDEEIEIELRWKNTEMKE